MRKIPLVILTLAFGAGFASTAASQKPTKELVNVRSFGQIAAADLERIEIETIDLRKTRPDRRAVTDLALELVAADGQSIDAALTLANGRTAAGGRRTLMRARVFLVAGGRLSKHIEASCTAWDGDVSICTVDCESGRFGLRRGRDAGVVLMLGRLPRDIDLAERLGFSVSTCGSQDEHRLVPKGGRMLVELPLRGE
jgi:hypothetical protein